MGALYHLGAVKRLKTFYWVSPSCAPVRGGDRDSVRLFPEAREDALVPMIRELPCTGSLTVHLHYRFEYMYRAHGTSETAFDPCIIKTNQLMIALSI